MARTGKDPTSRRGRHDAKTEKAVLADIALGMPDVYACRAAGINRTTWHRWKKRSAELRERAEQAEAKLMAVHLSRILEAGKRPAHWTASAWTLERRFHEIYGRKQQVQAKLDMALSLSDLVLASHLPRSGRSKK